MKLIADSGSTKTDWVVIADNGNKNVKVLTRGLNPVLMPEETLAESIEKELFPQLENDFPDLRKAEIHFYGAGCRPDMAEKMRRVLGRQFTESTTIEVQSDMLGAARSVGADMECIVAILGTGSNSCLFNGTDIMGNATSLGFILGDEGSGAVLGRNFVNALYEGRLTHSLREDFEKEYQLTLSDILQKVYREPMANRFLASFVPFMKKNIGERGIEELVKDNFTLFFKRNIATYGRKDLPINCVGGIANNFKEQLSCVAEAEGYLIGNITDKPIEGLLDYHKKH